MEIRFRVSGKTGTRLLSAPRRYQIIRIDALHHSGPKWDACTLRGSAHAIQIALLRKETQIQKLVVNFTQKCLPDSGKTERNSPAIPGASAKRPDRCPTPPLGELGCPPSRALRKPKGQSPLHLQMNLQEYTATLHLP